MDKKVTLINKFKAKTLLETNEGREIFLFLSLTAMCVVPQTPQFTTDAIPFAHIESKKNMSGCDIAISWLEGQLKIESW